VYRDNLEAIMKVLKNTKMLSEIMWESDLEYIAINLLGFCIFVIVDTVSQTVTKQGRLSHD